MKDNFDLKAYLVENKMTENSRGDVRHHLGETKLDTRLFDAGHKHILTEGFDHHDPDANYDPDAEADRADFERDRRRDEEALRQLGLDECGDFGSDGNFGLEEAGYADDDDPLADVPDLADIIGSDPGAKRAARAAQRDIDRDEKAAEKDDAAAAAADAADMDDTDVAPDVPVDTPAEPEAHPNKWVKGDLTMQSLFGQYADDVDILVGDDEMSNDEALQYLFRKNKNYRPNLLQREVRSAMQYFKEYEKPDKLYLIPAIDRGGYEQSRFNPGNRAVAVVYRPDSLSGDNWANQI